jgi:hypothetical protein
MQEYVGRTLCYVLFFGAIGIFFHSWFPLALGAFLFVADERFIEWALAKFGVRFVPDTLGLPFIDALVFFAGAWILTAAWSDSAPASLKPPESLASPWLFIVAAAFVCAAVKTLSTAAVKRLLPRVSPNIQSLAALGLTGVGLFVCVAVLQLF